jgi:hypothetical protein
MRGFGDYLSWDFCWDIHTIGQILYGTIFYFYSYFSVIYFCDIWLFAFSQEIIQRLLREIRK